MTMPMRDGNGRPAPRWNPLRDWEDAYQHFRRLLDQGTTGAGRADEPPVDVEDTDTAYLIEADVPGARPEDINVELRDNELRISGEIPARPHTGRIRHNARHTGPFDFRLELPGEVESEEIEARVENGVLLLRLPKAAKAKPHKIPVAGG